jgi:hypothetical protein
MRKAKSALRNSRLCSYHIAAIYPQVKTGQARPEGLPVLGDFTWLQSIGISLVDRLGGTTPFG